MSKYALTLSFFVYSYSVHMLKRALSSFGNLVVRKRIFFISVFINLAWFCPVATSCIAFWNHWQFWGKFPLSCLWVYFSSSLKENLFLIPKILYFDPIATSIFGCSLDLSKLNWIKINTVTNSSQIVSKISFLSWVASLRLLFFELKHLKIMKSNTGNRAEYLLAWIPLNSGNFTSMCGSVLYCLHIQKSS